jgi:hypothetical protein
VALSSGYGRLRCSAIANVRNPINAGMALLLPRAMSLPVPRQSGAAGRHHTALLQSLTRSLQNLTDYRRNGAVIHQKRLMEDIMIPQANHTKPSLVTVVFHDTALFFEIPAGATMGELADLLADLGEIHDRKPVVVDVQLVC